jgi:FkbM family methyltransferase
MNRLVKIGGSVLRFFGVSSPKRLRLFNYLRLVFFILSKRSRVYLRSKSEYMISSSFTSYLYGDKQVLAEKIEKLKNGTNSESAKIIDRILMRYAYIFENSLITDDGFCDQEIDDRKKINIKMFERAYPELREHEISTLHFHNGLKLVPDSVRKNIEKKTCIDAGAFTGDSALVFSKFYNFTKIYAFEPLPENYKILKENIVKYKLNNVEAVASGLGAETTVSRIEKNGSASSITEGDGQEVSLTTIDDLRKRECLEIGLIKMDIEGYELKAIKGTLETIREQRPVLLISIYHSGKDFFEIKPLLEDICPQYTFKIAKLNPFHLTFETMLIAWPNGQH